MYITVSASEFTPSMRQECVRSVCSNLKDDRTSLAQQRMCACACACRDVCVCVCVCVCWEVVLLREGMAAEREGVIDRVRVQVRIERGSINTWFERGLVNIVTGESPRVGRI